MLTEIANTAVYGGLYVESTVSLNTDAQSRTLFGFDPEKNRYVASSFSPLAYRIDHEEGHCNRDRDQLTFAGEEPFPNSDIWIRYERKFSFLDADTIRFQLLYPDMKPGRRQGMDVRLERR